MTEAEILDAIREAVAACPDSEPGVFTSSDIQQSLGWSKPKILTALRQMIAAKRVVPTRAIRTDIAGRVLPVPAYRIVS
jgi:hypothetical protein